jgi:aminopeptidase N
LCAKLTDGTAPDPALFEALDRVAGDAALDPAFRALALALPSEDDLAQALVDAGLVPDPTAIHTARLSVQTRMAAALAPRWRSSTTASIPAPSTVPTRTGRRAVPAQHLPGPAVPHRRTRPRPRPIRAASNMTDQIAAFTTLLDLRATRTSPRPSSTSGRTTAS